MQSIFLSKSSPAMAEGERIEDTHHVLTHLLTSPTLTPSLHSQLLLSSHFPCYLHWNFPPFLCRRRYRPFSWSFSFFLKRLRTWGFPPTSWRSKCPFQQPPPLLLAHGVEPAPAMLGAEERRAYARRRLQRRRLGSNVHPLIPFLLPNALLLLLLFWNPLSLRVGE